MPAVLLLGCIFARFPRYFLHMTPDMAQNKTPWHNILLVVRLNSLPITIIFCVNGS